VGSSFDDKSGKSFKPADYSRGLSSLSSPLSIRTILDKSVHFSGVVNFPVITFFLLFFEAGS
jgi:hypothetical protein